MSAPLLEWGPRPAGMACACGREPLCGFTDEKQKQFWCACCYSDGHADGCQPWGRGRPRNGQPRFRTPEERAKILGAP